MTVRPPLSIILPWRRSTPVALAVLDSVLAQARATGSELIVVGNIDVDLPNWVRVVATRDVDLFALRKTGAEHAEGELFAIAEDHAVPRPDWCAAVIRAHHDHPDATAVAGRLVNATDATTSGRASFFSFASQSIDPCGAGQSSPPPLSALSFKRRALDGAEDRLGWFESERVPRLFVDGQMVGDATVVVDHYQDHGPRWSIRNAFHATRSGYGYTLAGRPWHERIAQAAWALVHLPRRAWTQRARFTPETRSEPLVLALMWVNASALGIGAATGSLLGPGSSGSRVA